MLADNFAKNLDQFEKQVHNLRLTRTSCLQSAPQIRMIQHNDQDMTLKLQSSIVNTMPLWRKKIAMSIAINNNLPPYGNKLTRLTMAWDFDPHKLRDSQLEDTPVVLSYNNLSVLDKQTQRARVVVAYNPEDDTASIRRMDRARYDAIMKRKNAIAKRLKKEGASVRKAWCDAFPYLTSQPFWRGYLHLD